MTKGDLPLDDRLARIEANQQVQIEATIALRVEVATLKAKASLWGSVWGSLAGLLTGALISRLIGA